MKWTHDVGDVHEFCKGPPSGQQRACSRFVGLLFGTMTKLPRSQQRVVDCVQVIKVIGKYPFHTRLHQTKQDETISDQQICDQIRPDQSTHCKERNGPSQSFAKLTLDLVWVPFTLLFLPTLLSITRK